MHWTVVVDHLVERLLLTSEIHGLTTSIGKFLSTNLTFKKKTQNKGKTATFKRRRLNAMVLSSTYFESRIMGISALGFKGYNLLRVLAEYFHHYSNDAGICTSVNSFQVSPVVVRTRHNFINLILVGAGEFNFF